MHNHCGCNHVLKHCKICDVVYCEKCGKEWKTQSYTWYSYPQLTYTTYGNITTCDGATTSHTHEE